MNAYLHDTGALSRQHHAEELERTFRSWIEASPAINELAANNPLIREVKVRREEFPELGLLGLQAVGYVQAHQPPPAAWAAAQRALLKRASEHTELVDFVVLEPLNELLEATERP